MANLSASGSLANITLDPFWLANLIDKSKLLLPSSGLGNLQTLIIILLQKLLETYFTVGKSGSGSLCSGTGYMVAPTESTTFCTLLYPTPCMAV